MKRTTIAAIATAAWLLSGIIYLAVNWTVASQMTPNSWGDTLAGFFSPVAFLWLVIGYFQQGEELRISSDALRLQAEELRNSVEQQRQLVEVTTRDLELTKQSFEQERQDELVRAKPELRLHVSKATTNPPNRIFDVRIENIGYAASDVHISSNATHIRPVHVPVIDRGAPVQFRVSMPAEMSDKLWVEFGCVDGRDVRRRFRSTIQRMPGGEYRFTLPEEIVE